MKVNLDLNEDVTRQLLHSASEAMRPVPWQTALLLKRALAEETQREMSEPLYGVWSASRRVWYWANFEPLLYDDRRAAMALLCHAKAVAEQGTAYSENDWECRLVGMDGLPVDEGAQ